MVQAIGNRSRVRCTPTGPGSDGPAPGWRSVPVRITHSTALPGSEHLLGDAAGREFTALVPPALAAPLAGRSEWIVEAQMVGPGRIRVAALDLS